MFHTKEKIENDFQNVAKSKTFNNIKQLFALDSKAVFDVGCSYGEFLIHFGPGSIGLTITNEEAEYGRFRGLDVKCGNIESDKKDVIEKFDAVFANNIFEHLFSPHKFLCKIKENLRPGGILILGVPCIPKIMPLMRLRKFRGSQAVAHINFFTRDTLIKTVERGGWTIISARTFHFRNKFLDRLLDFISPHFYIVAKPKQYFSYHKKRMKELVGYGELEK